MLLRTLITQLQAFQQEMDAKGISDDMQEILVDFSQGDFQDMHGFIKEARLSIHANGAQGMVVLEI